MKAEIKTNKGTMKVMFYEEDAPNTVANFVKLSKSGFYNGLTFHRVIPDFVIQGGCPRGDGTGGPGYKIKCELNGGNQYHDRGVLSMARSMDPNSASSQFFIMHADAPHLDGQYAAFGKVIEGIEAVDEIASVDTDFGDRPLAPQVMKSVTMIEV